MPHLPPVPLVPLLVCILQPFLVSGGPARPPIPGEVPALDPIVGAPTQASSSKTVLRPCLGKSTFLLAVYPRLWDFSPPQFWLSKPICHLSKPISVLTGSSWLNLKAQSDWSICLALQHSFTENGGGGDSRRMFDQALLKLKFVNS